MYVMKKIWLFFSFIPQTKALKSLSCTEDYIPSFTFVVCFCNLSSKVLSSHDSNNFGKMQLSQNTHVKVQMYPNAKTSSNKSSTISGQRHDILRCQDNTHGFWLYVKIHTVLLIDWLTNWIGNGQTDRYYKQIVIWTDGERHREIDRLTDVTSLCMS